MRMLEQKIHKMVAEAIQEAGFRRFYKKPQTADMSRKGNIQISKCKLENKKDPQTGEEREVIAVYIGHVWGDGAQNLIKAVNGAVGGNSVVASASPAGSRDKVVIYIDVNDKASLRSSVGRLRDAIDSLDDYSEQSIDNLCDTIYDAVDSVATTADIENADKAKFANWKDMMKRLQDPEVRKALLAYMTTDNYARLYGHVLSPTNIKSILDQKPDASFVVEASTWRNKFNRQVRSGAQRIIVTKPTHGQVTQAAMDDAARQMGFASFKDAKEQTRGATQVLNKVKILASKNVTEFTKVVMYDVSDTIPPADPKLDKWTNEIGLSNNIMGVLNQPAAEFDNTLSGEHKEKSEKVKKEADAIRQNAMEARRSIMQRLCKRNAIDTSAFDNLDNEAFIVRATYTFAKQQMPQFNVIRPGDVDRIAGTCALVVAATLGIETSVVNKNIPTALTTTALDQEEDMMNVFTITDKIIPKLIDASRLKNVDPIIQDTTQLNERSERGGVSVARVIQMARERYGVVSDAPDNEDNSANEALSRKIQQMVREALSEALHKI